MVNDPATELVQPEGSNVAYQPTPGSGTGFFGHPIGLRTLFFTEMWERFSYYGMRAILILFMTASVAKGGLGFGADKAGPIYAMYTCLVYLATVPGGWLADNFLGQRRSVLWGGIVIMVGHILLAIHGLTSFFAGLGCIIVGTGLLKPSISVIVGQLYSEEDHRRDAGFSIFYMGINVGAFTAPLVCGWLAQSETFGGLLDSWKLDPSDSWHFGFAAAAVGMFFGLVQYVLTGSALGRAGLEPTKPASPEIAARHKRTLAIGVLAVVLGAISLLVIDSFARYLENVRYESTSEGLVASGQVKGNPSETLALNNGKPFDPAKADRFLGEDTANTVRLLILRQEVAAGSASGDLGKGVFVVPDPDGLKSVLDDFGIEGALVPKKPDQISGLKDALAKVDEVRIGGITFGSEEGSLTIKGRVIDEPSRPVSFDPIKPDELEDGFPESLSTLGGAIASTAFVKAVGQGRVNGALEETDVKVGGLNSSNINDGFTILLLLIVVGFFAKLFLAGEWTRAERARLVTIFVLFCGAAVFWGIFEQAGSTLTLFAERSTNNSFFGLRFPSSWWQSLNPLIIVCLAPLFAWLWIRLGKRNPSYPTKFGFGLLFASLGFAVLIGGAIPAEKGALVSPMWLFMVYLLHTIGELCLSPVGLSSMTKLAPVRVVSLMMGVWFLASAVGNFMGGSVAGLYEDFETPVLLGWVAAAGGVMAFIMFMLVLPIKRMMARSVASEPTPGQ